MVRLAWVNADQEPCPQGAGPLPSLTALASAAHVRYWRIEPATLDHDGGVWERVRRRLSLTTCTRVCVCADARSLRTRLTFSLCAARQRAIVNAM